MTVSSARQHDRQILESSQVCPCPYLACLRDGLPWPRPHGGSFFVVCSWVAQPRFDPSSTPTLGRRGPRKHGCSGRTLSASVAAMALAQCWREEVLTDLPWQATRWTGTAPTLSYQDAFLPGGVFPLYHEEANNARVAFHSRHPEAYQQMAAWTAAMGVLFPGEAQSHDGVWPTLFDLDWNLFLRVIFTNFAVRAGTHCVGVT